MTVKPTQILLSPLIVIFVVYIAVFLFQLHVVFPVEARFFPVYSATASLMFLPHAVRVLAAAIIGPKAFFLLVPATIVGSLIQSRNYGEVFNGTSLLMVLVGAASAPAGYIILKRIMGDRFVFSELMLNWRYVFFTGIIASAVNSVGLVAVYVAPAETTVILNLMLRFFVGDIFGLFVGLVFLTFVFRILRNFRTA
ncbi:MAG: hypothetical protein KAS85_09605 [Rhodobacteraceae bacterium]|nr:hypothetical protein [Paracoccaceae bacterium]